MQVSQDLVITGMKTQTEDLGAGDPIETRPTRHYRITADYEFKLYGQPKSAKTTTTQPKASPSRKPTRSPPPRQTTTRKKPKLTLTSRARARARATKRTTTKRRSKAPWRLPMGKPPSRPFHANAAVVDAVAVAAEKPRIRVPLPQRHPSRRAHPTQST